MVSVSGFSVAIISNGTEVDPIIRDGAYYISLPNGSHYKIRLSNRHDYRCNAEVSIDGESIGTFRLYSYQNLTLERPADIDKKFTFYRETSRTAQRAGVVEGKEENGLIRVQFIPEKRRRIYIQTIGHEYSLKGTKLSSLPQAEPEESSYRKSMPTTSMAPSGFMAPRSYMSSTSSLNEPVTRSLSFENKSTYTPEFSSGATILQGKSHQKFTDAEHMNLDWNNAVEIMIRLVVSESVKYPERVD